MPLAVAFLRAINVGGHTVKMDVLRGLFAQLGFSQISTFIASGNVIFDSPRSSSRELEDEIEAHLAAELGYPVATFTRTPPEVAAAAAYQPFPDTDAEAPGFRVYAGFLKAELESTAQKIIYDFRTEVDDFHIHGREVYWLCRVRSSDSTFSGAALGKALKMPATFRNMTTVRKIAQLLSGDK
jgi:uncharacterized protein (DUF1697 family)